MDHIEILGNTIEKIASEKAAAIRQNTPSISSKQRYSVKRILEEVANKQNSQLCFTRSINIKFDISLNGKHQYENAKLALDAINILDLFAISKDNIIDGLKTVKWPGRFQIIQKRPLVIFDVGHNVSGIRCFLNEFSSIKCAGKKMLIIALQSQKNIKQIIPLIEKEFDLILCTQTANKHSMPSEKLRNQFSSHSSIKQKNSIQKSILETLRFAEKSDIIAIIGSHYIGPAIREIFEISFD